METPPLTRVSLAELSDGPLPYCVYDHEGSLLYRKGMVIGSVGFLRLLVARGLYRRSVPAPTPKGPRATTTD